MSNETWSISSSWSSSSSISSSSSSYASGSSSSSSISSSSSSMCELYSNPVLVDSAPLRVGRKGERLYIREVVWQNPTAQGDQLILAVNQRAVVRVATAADTPLYVFTSPLGWVDTFGVSELSSGIVEIWLDEP